MRYLAVQIFDVKYDKAARGGEGARARARLPIALPLPAGGGRGVLHPCGLACSEDFAPRSSRRAPRRARRSAADLLRRARRKIRRP